MSDKYASFNEELNILLDKYNLLLKYSEIEDKPEEKKSELQPGETYPGSLLAMRWDGVAEESLLRRGYTILRKSGTEDYQGWGCYLAKHSSSNRYAVLS
jgi:hypothetical protein